MYPLVLVALIAVVLAVGIVRLFRLPIQWTGYNGGRNNGGRRF